MPSISWQIVRRTCSWRKVSEGQSNTASVEFQNALQDPLLPTARRRSPFQAALQGTLRSPSARGKTLLPTSTKQKIIFHFVRAVIGLAKVPAGIRSTFETTFARLLNTAIPYLNFLRLPKAEIWRDFSTRPRIFHECSNVGAQIRLFVDGWRLKSPNRERSRLGIAVLQTEQLNFELK